MNLWIERTDPPHVVEAWFGSVSAWSERVPLEDGKRTHIGDGIFMTRRGKTVDIEGPFTDHTTVGHVSAT